jgi:Protein of unknown function (DUF2711)
MTNIIPEPHRYAVCAPEDTSIKKFYQGVYEEAFIFFHPFIKPKRTGSEEISFRDFPDKNEIKDTFEVVTWERFLSLSGITNFKQLDIGLRSSISGLTNSAKDDEMANLIRRVCVKYNLFQPGEGQLPDILINSLFNSINQLGYDWIWCGDEFCTERRLEKISDLINSHKRFSEYRNFFTHYNELLVTTHWDSHYSMLCSSKKIIEAIVTASNLEGFYCDDKTEIYWSLQ